jgi:hypothetical protein
MAKVQGPLFSFGASGTVAKILTINQSLTRPTARKKPTGYGPASPMQAVMREEFRQAAESWRNLSASSKAEWIALSATTAQPAFAKYFLEWQAQQSTPAIPPFIPMA